jgi:hypothetical protein
MAQIVATQTLYLLNLGQQKNRKRRRVMLRDVAQDREDVRRYIKKSNGVYTEAELLVTIDPNATMSDDIHFEYTHPDDNIAAAAPTLEHKVDRAIAEKGA